ncbi:hypothetical protein FJU30_17050 [Affinibrenneria salicis]|uniref:Uncharacterized protein n=1 Tax=Affinibrenneria salicis TaxID=2590031 RepID=A0A5J5FXB8_9GAMM|nr:hypothetical protein [Affinibrenneria salicis]KAA8998123.1 hypothetical protein FJU30_17050 [Affinibrenneria salicis]
MNKTKRQWRIAIALHTIEDAYGAGNFDDAGDALLTALNGLSDYPGQYPCRIEMETRHPNPYYHHMLFIVDDLAEQTSIRLMDRVRNLGLA